VCPDRIKKGLALPSRLSMFAKHGFLKDLPDDPESVVQGSISELLIIPW
jgi:hypothetical protein